MNKKRTLTALFAAVLPIAVFVVACGNKEKEEETAPSAAPTPTPTPTPAPTPTPLVVEEDAGSDAGDAGDAGDAAPKVTGTGDPTGVRKCCNALASNQKSAPPDQQLAYGAAIAACNGMVNNPQGRQALAGLRSFLKGANMPADCK